MTEIILRGVEASILLIYTFYIIFELHMRHHRTLESSDHHDFGSLFFVITSIGCLAKMDTWLNGKQPKIPCIQAKLHDQRRTVTAFQELSVKRLMDGNNIIRKVYFNLYKS